MNIFKHFNIGEGDTNDGTGNPHSTSSGKDMAGKTFVIGGVEVRILKKIGEGGYSFVFLVQETMSDRRYALKRCIAVDQEAIRNIEDEIDVIKTLTPLNHPNLMKYVSHISRNGQSGTKEYYILTEFCPGGSLIQEIQACLDRNVLFPETKMVIVLDCVFNGLLAMHTLPEPVAHRDIKLENVLIDAKGVYKLCDFGSISKDNKIFTNTVEMQKQEILIQKRSTEMYRSPELCDLYRAKNNNWPISPKVDIWAVGNILYTLAYHTHPFEDGGYMGILSGRIVWPNQQEGSRFANSYSPFVNYIISRCFTMNPNNRPDAKEMIRLVKIWKIFLQTKQIPDDKIREEIRTWVPRIITDANSNITTENVPQSSGPSNPGAPSKVKKSLDLQEELRRLEKEQWDKIAQQEGKLRTQNQLQQQNQQQQQQQQQSLLGGNRRPAPPQPAVTRPPRPGQGQTPQQLPQQLPQNQPHNQNNSNEVDWGNLEFDANFDEFDSDSAVQTTTTSTTFAPLPQPNLSQSSSNMTPSRRGLHSHTPQTSSILLPNSSFSLNNHNNNTNQLPSTTLQQQHSSASHFGKPAGNQSSGKKDSLAEWGDFTAAFDSFVEDNSNAINNNNNNNNASHPTLQSSTLSQQQSTQSHFSGKSKNPNGDIFDTFDFDTFVSPTPSNNQNSTKNNQNNNNNNISTFSTQTNPAQSPLDDFTRLSAQPSQSFSHQDSFNSGFNRSFSNNGSNNNNNNNFFQHSSPQTPNQNFNPNFNSNFTPTTTTTITSPPQQYPGQFSSQKQQQNFNPYLAAAKPSTMNIFDEKNTGNHKQNNSNQPDFFSTNF
jgi:serine/threonine protein kinase